MAEKDYTIALISTNDFKFEELDEEKIPKYVTFEKVNMETMMKTIVEFIKLKPTDVGDTMFALNGKDYIIDVMFKQWGSENGITAEHETPEIPEKDRNMMVSRLILNNSPIAGQAVVLKMKIDKETLKCKSADITWKDVYNVLQSRVKHQGVKLLEDGTMSTFTYENSADLKGNWVDVDLFRYKLQICFQPINKEDISKYTVNKLASCLYGNRRIYGPVLVLLKSTNSLYGDLTIEELEDLIKCSEGKLSDRTMTQEEMQEGQKEDGMLLAANKYSIIRNRLKKYVKKCNYCGTTKNLKRCTGSYRVYYCSKACLSKSWRTYKKECHDKLPALNTFNPTSDK